MGCLDAIIPDAVATAARPRQRPVRGRGHGPAAARKARPFLDCWRATSSTDLEGHRWHVARHQPSGLHRVLPFRCHMPEPANSSSRLGRPVTFRRAHAASRRRTRVGLEPGVTNTLTIVVDESMTADRFGNTGVRVLETPMLVSYFELAAHQLAVPALEPGQGTVGSPHRHPSPGGHPDRHAGHLPGDPDRA